MAPVHVLQHTDRTELKVAVEEWCTDEAQAGPDCGDMNT